MNEMVLGNKLKYSLDLSSTGRDSEDEVLGDAKIASDLSVLPTLNNDEPNIVGPEEISRVASLWSGIPVQQLTVDDIKLLASLDEEYRKQEISQDEAVSAISKAVKIFRVGLKDPKYEMRINSSTSSTSLVVSSSQSKKGMVLPFELLSIIFDHVFLALMGVSGADKTTPIDVLAGRKIGGYIEGEIKIMLCRGCNEDRPN